VELATQLGSYGVLGIFAAIMAFVIRAQYVENRAKDAKILELYEAAARRESDGAKADNDVARGLSDLTASVKRAEDTGRENTRQIVDALNRRSSTQSQKAVVV
jgi:hypothetical protein